MAKEASMSLTEWRQSIAEKSFSALALSVWLADDLSQDYDMDIPWGFRYPTTIGHPAHVALGFRAGFDSLLDASELPQQLGGPHHTPTAGVDPYLVDSKLNDGVLEEDLFAYEDEEFGEDLVYPVQLVTGGLNMHDVLGGVSLASLFSTASDKESDTCQVGNGSESCRGSDEEDTDISNANPEGGDDKNDASETAVSPESGDQVPPLDDYLKLLEYIVNNKDTDIKVLYDNIPQKIHAMYDDLGIGFYLVMRKNRSIKEVKTVMKDSSTEHNKRDQRLRRSHKVDFLAGAPPIHLRMLSKSSSIASPLSASSLSGREQYIAPMATETECRAAGSYYFPVTQYVASHIDFVESGVGRLEEVSLSVGNLMGYQGDEDELHQHYEAEALAGDPWAMMWMGRRYWWGQGGVRPDHQMARRWFERAANANDPEGLYNVGVLHNNGQAGYARNPDVAMGYFERAANAPNPFPMALHALGNHYSQHSDYRKRNVTKARVYYEKAANMDYPGGHFALAIMLKEGIGGPVSIPLCVLHLAQAASKSHVRALNFLAHGLFDPESWLGQYGREEAAKKILAEKEVRRKKALEGKDSTSKDQDSPTPEPIQSPVPTDPSAGFEGTSKLKDKPKWVYNSSEPISVVLPTVVVQLPHPLRSSCEAALPLLKYIADMGYRSNDLTKGALDAYLEDDLWTAVDMYDEAAALGVDFAQENAAYLYSALRRKECAGLDDPSSDKHVLPGGGSGSDNEGAKIDASAASTSPQTSTTPTSTTLRSVLPDLSREQCERYFDRMTAHRWLQLASSGDYLAYRELADRILKEGSRGMPANAASSVYGFGFLAKIWQFIDTMVSASVATGKTVSRPGRLHFTEVKDDEMNTQSNTKYDSDRHSFQRETKNPILQKNETLAGMLYGAAASVGDVQSLMSLGWMLYGNGDIRRNATAARKVFSTAQRLEGSLFDSNGHDPHSTKGLAPMLARLYVELDVLLETYGFGGQQSEDMTKDSEKETWEYSWIYVWVSELPQLAAKCMGSMPSDDVLLISSSVLFATLLALYLFRRRHHHSRQRT
jgi:TPR repeat protein